MAVQTIVRDRARRVLAGALLFFLFSFLGWCMEKLWFYLLYGQNVDRGFLTLPFCTIYGGSLAAIRFFFGLPLQTDPPYPLNLLSLLLYAALASLVATAAELVTGLFFEHAFGLRLWSYYGYGHTYRNYICLPMSVAWGIMITAAIAGLWAPLERVLCRASVSALGWSAGLLSLAVLLDFCLCVAQYF